MPKPVQKDNVKINNLLKITETLNGIRDVDSLLDHILFEARLFTNADAGTIYLVDGNRLTFSYTHNDTKAKSDLTNNRFIYSVFSMPIDDKSIAGYVALTGKPLSIED